MVADSTGWTGDESKDATVSTVCWMTKYGGILLVGALTRP
jgi:hypothetical protein